MYLLLATILILTYVVTEKIVILTVSIVSYGFAIAMYMFYKVYRKLEQQEK